MRALLDGPRYAHVRLDWDETGAGPDGPEDIQPTIAPCRGTLREVVYVDGVRTAFGKAGPGGLFWKTRADDMAVKVVREVLRRVPEAPPERIGDVVFAATAQVGDQGLTLGRDVALLAGLPHTVPGMAVDRMCAGALTATTVAAGEIAMGAADLVLAGGVEHMGHHPMGDDVDFNPRFVAERLIDESAAVMGQTAENLHDSLPAAHARGRGPLRVRSQQRAAAAWDDPTASTRDTVVPMSVFTDEGWKVADRDEFLRPETTLDGLAGLRTPFRAGGRVTAGNSAGLTDGATACLLAAEETARELGLEARMRLVGFAYAGVEPHLMGLGPVPATRAGARARRSRLDDIGLFELNEPFAVQVLTWCEELGVDPDDPRLNPYGGAIACGHPLAATGVRLMAQLAYGFERRPDVRYGLTALCIGLGMGAALLWENLRHGVSAPIPSRRSASSRSPRGSARWRCVTIDNGADWQKPNTFGREALESLAAVLDELETGDWRGMVLTGKPLVFAAGADITQFPGITRRARPPRRRRPATSSSAGSAHSRTRRSPQ